uniref:CUB domain-containing protein n=1 Tax=Biomphalaria glabrata TaxID=6526 RepID=A0A2C9L4F0_BIOGL
MEMEILGDLNLGPQIYSGENSLGTPLASSLCQLGNTSFYLSESNQMFIRMRIHYSWYNSHKGFRATYITACGGTLDADEGIIMSPFFPGRYNRNSDCVWHITRTPVYLTFSHMDIPDYNPCTTSYLFLSYGENNNTYCGQAVPRPIYSESSPIMVNFHSGYLFGTGFKAKFSTYLTCSGNLTAMCNYICPAIVICKHLYFIGSGNLTAMCNYIYPDNVICKHLYFIGSGNLTVM